jgi:hypothetical protein
VDFFWFHNWIPPTNTFSFRPRSIPLGNRWTRCTRLPPRTDVIRDEILLWLCNWAEHLRAHWGIEMAAGHVWKPAPLMRHAPLNALAGMLVAVFERELGDAGFVEVAKTSGDRAVVLFFCGARERQIEGEIARQLSPKKSRRPHRHALNSYRAALRRALRPGPPTNLALRARTNLRVRNPRKLKQRFGAKTIRDVRFRVG